MTNGPETIGNEPPDPIQYEATATAYYQSVMGRATAARSRAQAGFAIVSAISAAVIAGSFTVQIDQAEDLTKWPAFLAVACWLLSAGLFLAASVSQPEDAPATADELSRSADIWRARTGAAAETAAPQDDLEPKVFVGYVPRIAREEARKVNKLVLYAGYASAAALLITVVTVITVVFFPKGPGRTVAKTTVADIVVTEPYFQVFLDECQATVSNEDFHELIGVLDVDSLNKHFLTLNIGTGICADQGQLEIPRVDVLQIEEYPKCSSSDLSRAEDTAASPITQAFSASAGEEVASDAFIRTKVDLQLRDEPSSFTVSASSPDAGIFPECGRARLFPGFFHRLLKRS